MTAPEIESIRYEALHGFEDLTRRLTGKRDLSCRDIEAIVFGRPKFRRQIGPLLQETFLRVASALDLAHVFEMGVMNGRHSQIILGRSERWHVHSFEPNLYCMPSLVPMLENPRLRLLPFAVSESTGFAEFHLPMSYLGKQLAPMSGVSSLHTLNDEGAKNEHLRPQLVATISTVDYLRHRPEVDAGATAVWIDTEGNSAAVLAGMGAHLGTFPVMIVEVEYGRLFSSSPNWNDVWDMLITAGYDIVGRDWQTVGGTNLLAIRPDLAKRDDVRLAVSEFQAYVGECAKL